LGLVLRKGIDQNLQKIKKDAIVRNLCTNKIILKIIKYMTPKDKDILRLYIPEKSIDEVCNLLTPFPVRVKIVRPRKRIHGSYRKPKTAFTPHLITVNSDLNPYTFLITLLHEIAHLQACINHKSLGHDEKWKNCFTALLKQFIFLDVFPNDVRCALENHIQNMKSSDFLDITLTKTLQKYDTETAVCQDLIPLEDVSQHTVFLFGNKKMEKQTLMRKYYLCKDLKTNKLYRCHPLMKVSLA